MTGFSVKERRARGGDRNTGEGHLPMEVAGVVHPQAGSTKGCQELPEAKRDASQVFRKSTHLPAL